MLQQDHPLHELVTGIARALDIGGTPEVVSENIAAALREAMKDPGLEKVFEGHRESFIAYEDPDRKFALHATYHKPGHITVAHDHGECWAIYGCYRGQTRYRRFTRSEDKADGVANLHAVRDEVAPAGSVDIVLPGEVHDTGNPGETEGWHIVVRPRPLSEVWRRRYDTDSGTYEPFRDTEPNK